MLEKLIKKYLNKKVTKVSVCCITSDLLTQELKQSDKLKDFIKNTLCHSLANELINMIDIQSDYSVEKMQTRFTATIKYLK